MWWMGLIYSVPNLTGCRQELTKNISFLTIKSSNAILTFAPTLRIYYLTVKATIFLVPSPLKNLAGLAECFGRSKELQEKCNLILVTNISKLSEASNSAEAGEIERLHAVIEQYQLHDRIRWIGTRLPSWDLGEVYRLVADRQGIFVHFARFEAFGRTILEAMISGLPAFATQFGGSLEIIQDKENGFHINPMELEAAAKEILDFITQCEKNPQYWQEMSDRAIKRVRQQYNWQLHTQQLLLLAKIYGFWRFVFHDNREALLRYLEALFHLLYKPRADRILEEHSQR
jgi:sucrose synthase